MNYKGGQMSQVSEQNDEIDLKELFAAIWHKIWFVLLASFVMALLAGYYSFSVATPLFKASTRFELLDDDNNGALLGSASGLASLAGLNVSTSSSEAEALEDRILSRPFVDRIYEAANFSTDPIYNGSLRPPGTISKVLSAVFGKSEEKELTRTDYLVMAVGALSKTLEIKAGDNGIIELTVKHPKSERAAKVANVIVDQSLLDIFERERQSTKDSLNYFADQLLEVRADLDTASAAVSEYAVNKNLQSQQELARSSSQLAQLRRDIENIDKSILALDKIGETGFDGSAFAQEHSVAASLTFRRLLNLSGDPSDWEKPSSREIMLARERLTTQREALTVSFNAIEARAKSSSVEALELAALQREVEVQQAIYESVITQFEARSLTSGYERASGRLVEYAIPPGRPSSPNKKLLVAIGILLGAFLGIGIVLARSNKRGSIHTLSTFRSAFSSAEVRKYKRQSLGRLDHLPVDPKSISMNQDILISISEGKPVTAILPTTTTDSSARLALSLSKASSDLGFKTALLDLSNVAYQKMLISHESEAFGGFLKYESASNVDILLLSDASIFLRNSEADKQMDMLRKGYQRIFVLLPALGTDTAISRVLVQLSDAALIVAETAKTNHDTADAIERILAKSKISEPLLVVT